MKRKWEVDLTTDVELAEDDLYSALQDLVTCVVRLGGVGGFACERTEVERGMYVNTKMVFSYDSYAPGVNRDEPQNGSGEIDRLEGLMAEVPATVEDEKVGEGEAEE